MIANHDCVKYPLFKITYNLFFHPLRKFPGPKSWAATRLTFILSTLQGGLTRDTWKLHEKYGDVVRIAPNELSFARPDAFDHILNIRQGRPPFPKNPVVYKGRPGQIADDIGNVASPAGHSRLRRAFDHAFTERALLAQEPVIQKYVELLIQRLTEEAISDKSKSCVVDMFDWYSYTTFDILGDLGFGESFDCLQNKTLHPWIGKTFSWIKALTFFASAGYFPLLEFALQKAIPESLLEEQREHFKYATDKIRRRMGHETMHEDFFSSILASKEGKGLSAEEIEESSHVIMLAGSDTTVTALCGITVNLLSNPEVLQKLTAEVRGTFNSVEEITLTSTKNLKYLHGVIQEGLRICNPVPFFLSRLVPKGGDIVCGHWLPEGVRIFLLDFMCTHMLIFTHPYTVLPFLTCV